LLNAHHSLSTSLLLPLFLRRISHGYGLWWKLEQTSLQHMTVRENGWTCEHKLAGFFGQGKHCLKKQEMFAQKCCVHLTVSCEVSVQQRQHQRGSTGPQLASRWKDLHRSIWTISQRPRDFLGIHRQGKIEMDQTFPSSDGLWSV